MAIVLSVTACGRMRTTVAAPPGRVQGRCGPLTLPQGETPDCGMRSSLAIGDFARATHMSIKTLRHYHRIGLLEPVDVDPSSGYRSTRRQIPTRSGDSAASARDMPLDEIQAVLAAPDPSRATT